MESPLVAKFKRKLGLSQKQGRHGQRGMKQDQASFKFRRNARSLSPKGTQNDSITSQDSMFTQKYFKRQGIQRHFPKDFFLYEFKTKVIKRCKTWKKRQSKVASPGLRAEIQIHGPSSPGPRRNQNLKLPRSKPQQLSKTSTKPHLNGTRVPNMTQPLEIQIPMKGRVQKRYRSPKIARGIQRGVQGQGYNKTQSHTKQDRVILNQDLKGSNSNGPDVIKVVGLKPHLKFKRQRSFKINRDLHKKPRLGFKAKGRMIIDQAPNFFQQRHRSLSPAKKTKIVNRAKSGYSEKRIKMDVLDAMMADIEIGPGCTDDLRPTQSKAKHRPSLPSPTPETYQISVQKIRQKCNQLQSIIQSFRSSKQTKITRPQSYQQGSKFERSGLSEASTDLHLKKQRINSAMCESSKKVGGLSQKPYIINVKHLQKKSFKSQFKSRLVLNKYKNLNGKAIQGSPSKPLRPLKPTSHLSKRLSKGSPQTSKRSLQKSRSPKRRTRQLNGKKLVSPSPRTFVIEAQPSPVFGRRSKRFVRPRKKAKQLTLPLIDHSLEGSPREVDAMNFTFNFDQASVQEQQFCDVFR